MKTALLSAIIVFLGCGGLSKGSENVAQPGFPPEFSTGSIRYRLDQAVLERSLSTLIDDLSKELKNPPSKRDAAKVRTLKLNLTLAIAAAGQYGTLDGKMKSILKSVIDDVNLANESIPEGFLAPNSLFLGMAAQAFVDSQGVPPDINVESMIGANFGYLAGNAYQMIETRGAQKRP